MRLSQIHIKKFRSIDDCKIDFDSNLKVLIGPNGTGKTNLLLALRFLSGCVNQSPIRAIQQAGGLDKVFTIRDRRAKEMVFQVKIDIMKESGAAMSKLTSEKLGVATYKMALQFEESSSVLIVKSEKLQFAAKETNVVVELFSRVSDTKKTKIEGLLSKIGPYKESGFGESVSINELAAIRLYSLLDRTRIYFDGEVSDDESKHYRDNLTIVRQVLAELASINGYNYDPAELRKSSDLLSSEGMNYSGKGFSSLLQRLTSDNYIARAKFRRINIRESSNEFFSQFSDVYKEILPFLNNVQPKENIDTTSVELLFKEIQQVESQKMFSTGHLSDGSLKFLAILTTLLLKNYSLLYIEEIENYLNPNAIKRLIQLMKDISETTGKKFLITSHSETVLNAVNPEDILVSRRSNSGSTTYEKFYDLNDVKKAVDEGGLGLGYLWGRGGLDGF